MFESDWTELGSRPRTKAGLKAGDVILSISRQPAPPGDVDGQAVRRSRLGSSRVWRSFAGHNRLVRSRGRRPASDGADFLNARSIRNSLATALPSLTVTASPHSSNSMHGCRSFARSRCGVGFVRRPKPEGLWERDAYNDEARLSPTDVLALADYVWALSHRSGG